MLCWILIAGGVLIMMGQHDRCEALFYYFRLEDQVPETHLLRLIEKHISFAFVREKLKASYSDTGRPSLDPELLLRILLIGYLYGITSERKLVEELRMHLAWRWFTGLGFDQEIPHHSTFSKNRHGRFQESKLFEQLFEQIVKQCVGSGTVGQGQTSVGRWKLLSGGERGSQGEPYSTRAVSGGGTTQPLGASVSGGPRRSRTRWKSQFISKTRYRPPIPILLTPPRAAHRLGWDTTTTTWSTIIVA